MTAFSESGTALFAKKSDHTADWNDNHIDAKL